jgi:hypothetical protein
MLVTLAVFAGWALPCRPDADKEPAPAAGKRLPKLCWSPARQAVLERMAREQHPLWQLARANAAVTGTRGERYLDNGCWLAWLGLTDPSCKRKAWDLKLSKELGRAAPEPALNLNVLREKYLINLILYSWVQDVLTDEEVRNAVAQFNCWADCVTGKLPPKYRFTDWANCNYTAGFLPVAITDLMPENPLKGTRLGKLQVTDYNRSRPLGTLDATDSGRYTSMRDALAYYAKWTEGGGGWPEEGQYRTNTPILFMMGTQALLNLTGKDHFPEWTAAWRGIAAQAFTEWTADKNLLYWQYGDDEHTWPRTTDWSRNLEYCGSLCGLTEGTPEGENLQHFVLNLPAYKVLPKRDPTNPYFRMYLFFNPYAPAKAAPLPYAHAAKAVGIVRYKDARSSASGHYTPNRPLQHSQLWVGAHWTYRDGEPLLDCPVAYVYGYSCPQQYPDFVNAAGVAGFTAESRVNDAALALPWKGLYLAGHCGGPLYGHEPRLGLRPTFNHELRSRLLWVPGQFAWVVHNRWDAQDPTAQPEYPKYYRQNPGNGMFDADRLKRIVDGQGVCEYYLHSPVPPTKTDYGMTWKTPGGQSVCVSVVAPKGYRSVLVDEGEDTTWAKVNKRERKFHTALAPPPFPDKGRHFATMLTVEQPDQATASPVRSEDGHMEGALLGDPAKKEDALALFPAAQGQPYRKTTFKVSWTANAGRTRVCVGGLDGTKTWTVDGADSGNVTTQADGYAEVQVTGAGQHTLTFTAR